jgi:hypothetical protein
LRGTPRFHPVGNEVVNDGIVGFDFDLKHCQGQGFRHCDELLPSRFRLGVGALDLTLGLASLNNF